MGRDGFQSPDGEASDRGGKSLPGRPGWRRESPCFAWERLWVLDGAPSTLRLLRGGAWTGDLAEAGGGGEIAVVKAVSGGGAMGRSNNADQTAAVWDIRVLVCFSQKLRLKTMRHWAMSPPVTVLTRLQSPEVPRPEVKAAVIFLK